MLYLTTDYEKLLFVNLKCCFSTCQDLVQKGMLIKLNVGYDNKRVKDDVIKTLWKLKRKRYNQLPAYIIVRNPEKRLISFYRDKFVKNKIMDGKVLWQVCQKNMLKYIPEQRILDDRFTFHQFINTLKQGYSDGHINSQINILKQHRLLNSLIHLRMEEPNFNLQLAQLLNISPESIPKNNHTGGKQIEISLEDKIFIRQKYQKDFLKFGY